MNYIQVIQELFSRRHCIREGGLHPFYQIAKSRGSSYSGYPSVHIAGTNGKGSVSLKMARALELAGLKVGLFTSPHLESFCERITINGSQIPEEIVRQKLPLLFKYKELCFFELATLLAFDYFLEENVDIVVFEAGMGGLEDATNVITPLVSVITSIAKDHEEFLGSTLDEIAYQKGGIIKPGVPVVLGPSSDYPCIQEKTWLCRSPVYQVAAQPGFYDLENSAVAKEALKILQCHFPLTDAHIEEGIKNRPPCRFECQGRVIFDVAHNVAGFQRLMEAIALHYPGQSWSAVVGMSADKDIRSCLKLLAAKAAHLYLVPSPSVKAIALGEMSQLLQNEGILHFSPKPSIQEGVKAALEATDGLVVICGSFYIMQEARQEIFRI